MSVLAVETIFHYLLEGEHGHQERLEGAGEPSQWERALLSLKREAFDSWQLYGGLQPPATPVSGDLRPSSDLCGH